MAVSGYLELRLMVMTSLTTSWCAAAPATSSVEYTSEDYAKVMSTNFESAFHFSQIAHPLLKASGVGSIVFVSSVAGLVYASAGPIYGATKGGLNQLTRNLACEWACDNIRTNSVAPWYLRIKSLWAPWLTGPHLVELENQRKLLRWLLSSAFPLPLTSPDRSLSLTEDSSITPMKPKPRIGTLLIKQESVVVTFSQHFV
ncbi:tropinone reductase homolog At2g29360-like isoform X2 [Brassica napus]|uniref:tropinone reductase homolog At2g29360-like isoform X2 n=1 Tax=Brassica napus TaxID=3708 RepID=UPI0020798DD1|nr:tropinone reductase homolog At2g29360-like isoform X2 [Brassica napus]